MVDKVSPVITAPMETVVPKTEPMKKLVKAKVPRAKPSHPGTAEMVNTAIKTLVERNGSSLQSIKKYLVETYKIDAQKHALFIKKYLKSAVAAGALVQTKGTGASGSFKLPGKPPIYKSKPKKAVAVKKVASPKKVKLVKKSEVVKAVVKKTAAPKKPSETKAVKKIEKVIKPKTPSKAKKATRVPTAKPKAPKPKKVMAKVAIRKPIQKK